jgi:hypothetical protein
MLHWLARALSGWHLRQAERWQERWEASVTGQKGSPQAAR